MSCHPDLPEEPQTIHSYIVRVYRRSDLVLAGIVEDCLGGREAVFHGPEELWEAITGSLPNANMECESTSQRSNRRRKRDES